MRKIVLVSNALGNEPTAAVPRVDELRRGGDTVESYLVSGATSRRMALDAALRDPQVSLVVVDGGVVAQAAACAAHRVRAGENTAPILWDATDGVREDTLPSADLAGYISGAITYSPQDWKVAYKFWGNVAHLAPLLGSEEGIPTEAPSIAVYTGPVSTAWMSVVEAIRGHVGGDVAVMVGCPGHRNTMLSSTRLLGAHGAVVLPGSHAASTLVHTHRARGVPVVFSESAADATHPSQTAGGPWGPAYRVGARDVPASDAAHYWAVHVKNMLVAGLRRPLPTSVWRPSEQAALKAWCEVVRGAARGIGRVVAREQGVGV